MALPHRIRLTFLDRLITEPVIYQIGNYIDILNNIRRAYVQENIGWVILELEGEESEIERSLDWVRSLGVRIDPAVADVVEG